MEKIKKIAENVQKQLEKKHGKENKDFFGTCIEAAERIGEELEKEQIPYQIIEGWCLYDNEKSCSDRPYDEHTWIETQGIYVDITAIQFQPYIDQTIPKIIVGKKPDYMVYEEPME